MAMKKKESEIPTMTPVGIEKTDNRDAQIEALQETITNLRSIAGDCMNDLAYLGKTHHSEYAQRRHKEVLAALDKVKDA